MRTPDWLDPLSREAARLIDRPWAALPHRDMARAGLRVGPLYANFARQRIDTGAWQVLHELARRCRLPEAAAALMDGETVNRSEQRAALHTALRGDLGRGEAARAARAEVLRHRPGLQVLAERLRHSGVTDLINIGIGGSDLGPRLLDAAWQGRPQCLRLHFLSSPDGHSVDRLIAGLDPARTAVLLVSKSFGTEETRLNGRVVLDWLKAPERVYAVSANVPAAVAFGVPAEQVMPMWDWVGGRYSLWSAVGFAVRVAFGDAAFEDLLAGAAAMDQHFLQAPLEHNLPIQHALVAIWNRNALGYDSQAVLPYDQRLALLPAYLQQLTMESLGKSVLADGSAALAWSTAPVIWGGPGTDCQHSYFQALHQATDTLPSEFIGVIRPDHQHRQLHRSLLANLLAQSEALALGATRPDDRHRHYPGSRPNSVLLLDQLSPNALGHLLAMYEHSVYAQSVLWGINAFDQWGVELGKRTASALAPALDGEVAAADPVSAALIAEIRGR